MGTKRKNVGSDDPDSCMYDASDEDSVAKLFSVPDFIGFAAKQVGSHIRAAVAKVTFDEFHKHSSKVIQVAVFGEDKRYKFSANNLVITNIDIQSIEPVDIKMRDSLMKSVQMAIEISTKSIEATAAHEAARLEQVASGNLERQKLCNEKEAEKARGQLLLLQSQSAAVESTGQAVAEAQAEAQRINIECESQIESARFKAKALDIIARAELDTLTQSRQSDNEYLKILNNSEVAKWKEMSRIEVNKFSEMIKSIGADTIRAIATAGPETKAKLLASLGIESTLITDGNSPINLFNTAEGLVAGQ